MIAWMNTGKRIVATKHFELTIAPSVWLFVAGIVALSVFMPTK